MSRSTIKTALEDPKTRRALLIRMLVVERVMNGASTTLAQAEAAYDRLLSDVAVLRRLMRDTPWRLHDGCEHWYGPDVHLKVWDRGSGYPFSRWGWQALVRGERSTGTASTSTEARRLAMAAMDLVVARGEAGAPERT